jgi:Uma2 family endonuclease
MLAEIQLKPSVYIYSQVPVQPLVSRVHNPKLPTMYELPCESPEDGMPDRFHVMQPHLLSETFIPPTYPNDRVLAATDLYLYYDAKHTAWYKRPDWFAVLGVPLEQQQSELRWSYLLWEEKVAPYVIVELLSPGTEQEDLGETDLPGPGEPPRKWDVYEQILKVPYYLVYGRYTNELHAYRLQGGRYRKLPVTPGQGVWLPRANLGIGVWEGKYEKVKGLWLRCYDADGNWIPSWEETSARERREKERERREKEAALQLVKQERREKTAALRLAEQERGEKETALRLAEQEQRKTKQEQREKEAALQQLNQMRAQLRALGIEPKI